MEETYFDRIISDVKITDMTNTQMSGYVTSVNNIKEPIHSWYNLKEGYSSEFPIWILDYLLDKYQFSINKVLDPFSGSGTSIISLGRRGITCDGIEYNPFIYWMGKTKIEWNLIPIQELTERFGALSIKRNIYKNNKIPNLSTFNNDKYFDRRHLRKIIDLKRQILDQEGSSYATNFLLLVLINSLNAASSLKKDGRALRFVRDKIRVDPRDSFLSYFHAFKKELYELQKYKKEYQSGIVINSSSLEDNAIYEFKDKYDLVLFSPPYLNGFDYSEIYKLELWILEFVKNSSEWLRLRRKSFQSHWSVKFESKNQFKKQYPNNKLLNELKELLTTSNLNGSRKRVLSMVDGFVEDTYNFFQRLYSITKPGGLVVYIVSTSMYGDCHLQTDLIMADIANATGFSLSEVIVLNRRKSRVNGSYKIRDSVVILKK
jgi:DNA modification methylase